MWEAQLRDVQVLPFLRRQHSAWANFAKDPSSGVGRWNYQVLGLDTLNTWGFIKRAVHIFEIIWTYFTEPVIPAKVTENQCEWETDTFEVSHPAEARLGEGGLGLGLSLRARTLKDYRWAEICMGLRHVRTFSGNSWLIHPNFQRLILSRCAKASCTEPMIAAVTLGMSPSRSWSILNEPSPEVAVAPGSSTGCRCFTHQEVSASQRRVAKVELS